jgi:hypothetical protein
MSFPASYPGRCGGCTTPFDPGTEVEYDGGGGVLIAVDCCGDPAEPGTRAAPAPDRVMPRGKKAADRCGTCFQVPAANGACWCP